MPSRRTSPDRTAPPAQAPPAAREVRASASDGRDIDSYAAVGDGRTVALIGRNGRVDWLPLPDLDSRPVFAHLLDEESGGCIELAPVGDYSVRRRYVKNTNVLRTTVTTPTGKARITDAMVTGVAGRLPWAELARRVEGLEGTVQFAWRVAPGTRLQTSSPWVDTASGHVVLRCGEVSLGVVGVEHGEPVTDEQTAQISGGFETRPDSRHLLVVAATSGEPLHLPDPGNVDRGVDRTVEGWRAWSREFSYEGPWSADVQRSALALKLLIFSPTGAIAAAATTSVPESPAGGKNWDYRYAWIRDLAYTAHALVWFGLREETHAALSWLLRTVRENGPEIHVMYSLEGGTSAEPREYDVPGWRGIGPVVTGNPAQGQLQLGVYGDLVSICRTYVEAGNVLDIQTARLLSEVADRTCDLWRNPDSGMWELPDIRHYTSSKMGCWQALSDAIALAEGGYIPGDAKRWRRERERIRAWIDDFCWSERLGAYVMAAGSEELDASVLLHAPSGFDRGERMSRTIDALAETLGGSRGEGAGADDLLYRYTGADREEHTFVACAFWRVSALACVGRHDEAIDLMDRLVARTNDVGLLSEMISAKDGSFWGNTPQALSHLALINAALTIRDLVPDSSLRSS